MLPSVLITFREVFEVALVVGIILTTLSTAGQRHLMKTVWQGVATGILFSVVVGYGIHYFVGEFSGRYEKLFEGSLFFITAGFLTWMILWVHQQERGAFRTEIHAHMEHGFVLGIFILSSVSVVREGVETALYLIAAQLQGAKHILLGSILGTLLALTLGYAFFNKAKKFNLAIVFRVCSIILLLFAAGLISHGVGEFQELGWLPLFSFDPLINLSHLLSETSLVGSLLHSFIGYTSTPSLLQVVAYVCYIVAVLLLERRQKSQ